MDDIVVKAPTTVRIGSAGPARDAVPRRDVYAESAAGRPAADSAHKAA
ncbi:hypothetical protein [Streptomyces sp. NPDC057238]